MLHWCTKCQAYVPTDKMATVRTVGEKRYSETTHHCRVCKSLIFTDKHEIRRRIERR